jgi:hypothetical protein
VSDRNPLEHLTGRLSQMFRQMFHAMPVTARRRIARAYIVIGIACLVAQAAGVRMIHHSLAVTILGCGAPVAAVLFGLYYLRTTKGDSQ